MHSTLLKIGPLSIHSYGLMLALSFLFGIYFTIFRCKRNKLDAEKVMDLALYLVLSAVIGARLFHVLLHIQDYTNNFFDIFAVWEGGLTMQGGVIMAVIVSALYLKKNKMPVWKMGDMIAPSIGFGIFLTRIGCFLNGCCHGLPSSMQWPFSMVFPNEIKVLYFNLSKFSFEWIRQVGGAAGYYCYSQSLHPGLPIPVAIHPTQLYSSAYGLLIFAIILIIERFKPFDGFLIWMVVLLDSIFRFFIDFVRYYDNNLTIGTISISQTQITALIMFCFSAAMLILFAYKSKKIGKKI